MSALPRSSGFARSWVQLQELVHRLALGGYAARAASVTLVSPRNMPLSLSTGSTRRFDKLRVIVVEARMSTTVALTNTYTVQWLIESRPPSVSWSRPTPPQSNQPTLDFADHEPDHVDAVEPDDGGVRVSMVNARWAARQRAGLPDARAWSTALALALIQTLLGQRAVSQLNRWVAEEVLAAISMYQRRSLRVHGRIAVPSAVRSVRVQHPDPEVAEVAAHVVIGKRSAAMAFRLEALGDRWLCTALELGSPRGASRVSVPVARVTGLRAC
jgi:Family of unknown function (DUF6459)